MERLFDAIPRDLRAAFIVVQHLSPDHKSLMADLLGKHTPMPVREAVDGLIIEPGTVAMVPPRSNLEVEGDQLRLRERAAPHSPNLPINLLFRSLAERFGERAVGIVLSGTGSDGRLGIEAIKQAGGLVLVQDPATARFDGMPLSAISTGLADAVVAPQAMGEELLAFAANGNAGRKWVHTVSDELAMQSLQARLLRGTGIDFAEYKPATVMRRIARRMAHLSVDSLAEYARRLEHDAAEVQTLARELLINVTQFFRDTEVFTELETKVLPALVARVGQEQLRVWVPGCSSGQEAYTLAMLLTELAPPGGFKVFATDVDPGALEQAALGRYPEAQLADVSPERRARFFRRVGDNYEVERELRRRIVFAPHNVARDPPFTRLDLVSCRNLLIYLSAALQKRVLATFAFSLKSDGVMLLGSSESLGDVADRFRVIDPHLKIYQRLAGPRVIMPELAGPVMAPRGMPQPDTNPQAAIDAAFQLLVDRVAPAAVLVKENLDVLRVFGNAESLLSVPIGATTVSLIAMLPDGLKTITALAAQRALTLSTETVMAVASDVRAGVGSLRVQPFTVGRGLRYLVITFEKSGAPADVPVPVAVSDEAQQHFAELQRELHFVRESLQATIEELETSNEELRATNEELLASNEELQSTNEELQSVNEELNTVNVEHQEKIAELVQANADLDNLFNASPVGILFLDEQLQVRRFTPEMTQQFSLLPRDVGRPVEHITHQFKDFSLSEEVLRVQATAQIVERELTSRGGHRYLLRISPYLTATRHISGVVATFVDVTQLRDEQHERQSLQNLIDSISAQVAVLGTDGVIRFVNRSWSEFARQNRGDVMRLGPGADYLDACRDVPELRSDLEDVLHGRRAELAVEYPCHGPNEQRWFVMNATPLADGAGAVITHTNITARKRLESDRVP